MSKAYSLEVLKEVSRWQDAGSTLIFSKSATSPTKVIDRQQEKNWLKKDWQIDIGKFLCFYNRLGPDDTEFHLSWLIQPARWYKAKNQKIFEAIWTMNMVVVDISENVIYTYLHSLSSNKSSAYIIFQSLKIWRNVKNVYSIAGFIKIYSFLFNI